MEVDGADLGAERMVYLGRSVEGVLRHRKVEELARIFRDAFVCIRRYRTTGRRLLPLVLDAPRLLKNNAAPSHVALRLGLQPAAAAAAAAAASAATPPAAASSSAPPPPASAAAAEEAARYDAALSKGLRLFNVYLDACGALYLRPTIWRRLVPLLHPDKGGDVAVFQRVSEMKRLVDLGEEVRCHADDVAPRGDEVDDAIARLRAEMREGA